MVRHTPGPAMTPARHPDPHPVRGPADKPLARALVWLRRDLRVDDHADPLAELERLEAVSRERFVHFARFFATRADAGGTWDRSVIEAALAQVPPPGR